MKEWISQLSSPKVFKSNFSTPHKMINLGWQKLCKIPGGKHVFSTLISRYIPYTGSIKPHIENIEKGTATVMMKDKHSVRNHLDSIHALALANLGELTTGLCLFSQLKDNQKAILTNLNVEYLKKARNTLKSRATYKLPETFENDSDFTITAEVINKENQVVSKVHATWRVRTT